MASIKQVAHEIECSAISIREKGELVSFFHRGRGWQWMAAGNDFGGELICQDLFKRLDNNAIVINLRVLNESQFVSIVCDMENFLKDAWQLSYLNF